MPGAAKRFRRQLPRRSVAGGAGGGDQIRPDRGPAPGEGGALVPREKRGRQETCDDEAAVSGGDRRALPLKNARVGAPVTGRGTHSLCGNSRIIRGRAGVGGPPNGPTYPQSGRGGLAAATCRSRRASRRRRNRGSWRVGRVGGGCARECRRAGEGGEPRARRPRAGTARVKKKEREGRLEGAGRGRGPRRRETGRARRAGRRATLPLKSRGGTPPPLTMLQGGGAPDANATAPPLSQNALQGSALPLSSSAGWVGGAPTPPSQFRGEWHSATHHPAHTPSPRSSLPRPPAAHAPIRRPRVPPVKRADRPTPLHHHTRKRMASKREFSAPALINASLEAGHPPAGRGRRFLWRAGRDRFHPGAVGLRGADAAGCHRQP